MTVLISTVVLMLAYILADILFSKELFLIKNICFGISCFFFSFVIVSGILFGINNYSLELTYVICFMIAALPSLLMFFLRYKCWNALRNIERVKYFPKELLLLLIFSMILSGGKFGFKGMGSDEGVYQNKALYLINNINDNQIDFKAYYSLRSEADREKFESFATKPVNLTGFYPFSFNQSYNTRISPKSAISGYLHGIPTFPALLSICGKIMGFSNMMHILTIFYLLALVLMYLTLHVNLKTKMSTAIIITSLLMISPVILWLSKVSLTETFLTLIVAAFLYLLTCANTFANRLLWLPVASFAFLHISIYTIMPLFVVLFVLLFIQRRDIYLLLSGLLSVFAYSSGFMSMCYSSPAYTLFNCNYLVEPLAGLGISYGNLPQFIFIITLVTMLFLIIAYFIIERFKDFPDKKMMSSGVKWFLVIFSVIFVVKWIDMSFLSPVPDPMNHDQSYKNAGLIRSLPKLTFIAYTVSTGFILLPAIIIALLRGKQEFVSEKNLPVTIVFLYVVVIYSIFMKLDLFAFVHFRYIGMYCPVIFILAGIYIDSLAFKQKLALSIISITFTLPFTIFIALNEDRTHINTDLLKEVVKEVSYLNSDDIVFMSTDILSDFYISLDALTNTIILPSSDYDIIKDKLLSHTGDVYALSSSRLSDDNYRFFRGYSSFFILSENAKFPLPAQAQKINYYRFLEKIEEISQ
ncbi:MAG: hypothetical protein LBE13_14960 [Bacteroidales bacterium]|jgi:hypothetical protein|nr:hypothetical protein [Bacteroidales bacterium]